jgi:hypothetical protein
MWHGMDPNVLLQILSATFQCSPEYTCVTLKSLWVSFFSLWNENKNFSLSNLERYWWEEGESEIRHCKSQECKLRAQKEEVLVREALLGHCTLVTNPKYHIVCAESVFLLWYLFFFLMVWGFELRVSHLLGNWSSTWIMSPALVYFTSLSARSCDFVRDWLTPC